MLVKIQLLLFVGLDLVLTNILSLVGNVSGAECRGQTRLISTPGQHGQPGASLASGVTFEENKEKDNNDSIRSG